MSSAAFTRAVRWVAAVGALAASLIACEPSAPVVFVDTRDGVEFEAASLAVELPPVTNDTTGAPWTSHWLTLRNRSRQRVLLSDVRAEGVSASFHLAGAPQVLQAGAAFALDLELPVQLEPGTQLSFEVRALAPKVVGPRDGPVTARLRFELDLPAQEPSLELRVERVPNLCPVDRVVTSPPIVSAGQRSTHQRTVRNASDRPMDVEAQVALTAAPPDASVVVEPARFRLEAGGLQTLVVSATSPALGLLSGTLALVGPPGCRAAGAPLTWDVRAHCLQRLHGDGGLELPCTPVGSRSSTTVRVLNGCTAPVDVTPRVEGVPDAWARAAGQPVGAQRRHASDEVWDYEVGFAPTAEGVFDGGLVLDTWALPLDAVAFGPRVSVTPTLLLFGVVSLADAGVTVSAPQFVRVANAGSQAAPPIGRCALSVDVGLVSVEPGSPEAVQELCVGEVTTDGQCAPLMPMLRVAPDAGVDLPVRVLPLGPGLKRWRFTVLSNDPERPRTVIDVSADVRR